MGGARAQSPGQSIQQQLRDLEERLTTEEVAEFRWSVHRSPVSSSLSHVWQRYVCEFAVVVELDKCKPYNNALIATAGYIESLRVQIRKNGPNNYSGSTRRISQYTKRTSCCTFPLQNVCLFPFFIASDQGLWCVDGRWAWARYCSQHQNCSSRDLGLKLLELQSLLGAKRQITEKVQSLRGMQLIMKCPKVSLESM